MMRWYGLAVLGLWGCDGGGGGLSQEEVQGAVRTAFETANRPGRTGLLLKGRTGVVWWEASMFDKGCLEQKDLAFNDDPTMRPAGAKSIARISPTYQNQWGIVAATPTGYCVDLGTDPKIQVGEPVWAMDRYKVDVTLTMTESTPWFECLEAGARSRTVEVTVTPEETPRVETPLDLFQGDCPHPVVASKPRVSRTEPTQEPPAAPTAADVQRLVQALDDALAAGDSAKALEMVSCYNLFEKEPYGSCSLAEIIAHGSVKGGEANPWLEYAITDFSQFGKPTPDREKPTLFHSTFKHKRNGNTRSLSVQWVGGEWKLVGIVSQQAEGLTVARFLNDLHDKEKRDIFKRRLAGEPIDYQGQPLDPHAEEAEGQR